MRLGFGGGAIKLREQMSGGLKGVVGLLLHSRVVRMRVRNSGSRATCNARRPTGMDFSCFHHSGIIIRNAFESPARVL